MTAPAARGRACAAGQSAAEGRSTDVRRLGRFPYTVGRALVLCYRNIRYKPFPPLLSFPPPSSSISMSGAVQLGTCRIASVPLPPHPPASRLVHVEAHHQLLQLGRHHSQQIQVQIRHGAGLAGHVQLRSRRGWGGG